MFKDKVFWVKVLKDTFALLACAMVFFASLFPVYAAESLSSNDFSDSVFTGVSRIVISNASDPVNFSCFFYDSNVSSITVPVTSVTLSDYSYKDSTTGVYNDIFSGEFTVRYRIWSNYSAVNLTGACYVNTNISFNYLSRVTVLNGNTYPDLNTVTLSVKDAKFIDSTGRIFYPLSNSKSISYTSDSSPGSYWSPQVLSRIKIGLTDAYICLTSVAPYSVLDVTYSVVSDLPISRARCDFSSFTPPSDVVVVDSVPQPVAPALDGVNNKLQNLTDGYDQSGIDNTNQQLGDQLNSFDQAEDAAIDSVTDYFGQIQQPISFFNAGQFLTSTSFVWTYLQGIYEHLGQAKIVVDVVLALIVAFSFIGLGKYIWRVADQEDSS